MYAQDRPPLCYPRLLSLPLIIILSLTWVAWVASFLADFGVVSGRKRQIMLPTALFWTVGSAPLQVWTSPFCRKTRHLCSTRRFLQKNLQVGSFFAFCMLFQGPPGGSSGRTRDLQTRLCFDRKSSFSDPHSEKSPQARNENKQQSDQLKRCWPPAAARSAEKEHQIAMQTSSCLQRYWPSPLRSVDGCEACTWELLNSSLASVAGDCSV